MNAWHDVAIPWSAVRGGVDAAVLVVMFGSLEAAQKAAAMSFIEHTSSRAAALAFLAGVGTLRPS